MIAIYQWVGGPKGWGQQCLKPDCELTEPQAIELLGSSLLDAWEGQKFKVARERSTSWDYVTVNEFEFVVERDGDQLTARNSREDWKV